MGEDVEVAILTLKVKVAIHGEDLKSIKPFLVVTKFVVQDGGIPVRAAEVS